MNIRTHYDFSNHSGGMEKVNTDDCRVVPNMALSVKEILRRFTAGTLAPVDDPRYVDYGDEDVDTAPVEIRDLSDITEMSVKKAEAMSRFVNEVNNTNK